MSVVQEPDRTTAPELADVLAELSRLEPIFHWPPAAMTLDQLKRMTVDGFWETGASGRRYSREYVLQEIAKRQAKTEPDMYEASEFQVQQLCPDLYLLSYSLVQDGTRLTRRSSIWRRTPDGWKVVYHQGTVVS